MSLIDDSMGLGRIYPLSGALESAQKMLSFYQNSCLHIEPSMLDSIKTSLQTFDRIKPAYDFLDNSNYSEFLKSLVSDNIGTNLASAFLNLPLANADKFRNIFLHNTHLIESLTTAISDINNKELVFEDVINNIGDEEAAEFQNDIEGLSSEKLNWQQKLFEIYKKWAKKNPILAGLLTIFISCLLTSALDATGLAKRIAQVREAPNIGSEVVFTLEPNQSVEIIAKEPYYYLIQVEDEGGETKSGWVAIRNVGNVTVNYDTDKGQPDGSSEMAEDETK